MLRGTSYGLERDELGLFTDGFCDLLICSVLLGFGNFNICQEQSEIFVKFQKS